MPQKPGHGNPNRPSAPSAPEAPSVPVSLTLSPDQPTYGQTLVVGYTPASPILTGHTMHFTVTSTTETQTDTDALGPGQVIEDETKSVSSGAAAQHTTFQLSGGSEWTGGIADGNVDLNDSTGHTIASATFTILG